MKKLIVLRGNSGSGKTTTAMALQKRFGPNTMRISQDMVRREMLSVRDGPDTAALPLLMELLRYANAHSEVTILEGILNRAWYGPLFALVNELYGGAVYAYYFDLPFEETLARHRTKPNRREFGEAELRRWWLEKDYAEPLHERTITKEMGPERIAAEIYADVMEG